MSVGADWNPSAVNYSESDRQSFDIWSLCRRRKWLIALTTLISLGLGWLYFQKAQRVYEVEAEVLVAKRRNDSGSPLKTIEGELGYEDSISTHILLIKSPVVVHDAVDKAKLYDLSSIKADGVLKEHVTQYIIDRMTVGRAGGREAIDSHVIAMQYESTKPDEAKVIVREIIDAYERFLDRTYKTVSDETIKLITDATENLSKKLDSDNNKIQEYELNVPVAVGVYFKKESGTSKAAEDYKRINVEITGKQNESNEIESLIQTILKKQAEGTTVDQIIAYVENHPNTKLRFARPPDERLTLDDPLIQLKIQEMQALQKYGENHPEVRRIRETIEFLKQYLDNIKAQEAAAAQRKLSPEQHVEQFLSSLRMEQSRLQTEISGKRTELETAEAAVKQANEYESKLRELHVNYDATKALLATVQAKMDQINLVKDYGGFNIETIAAPDRVRVVNPIIWKVLSVAGFLGLVLGLGLAVLVDLADKSFRNPEEVRHELGVPILGHLPVIVADNGRRKKGEPVSPIGEMVCTFHKPKSTNSEAYRAVRTALNFGIRGEGHKVIQITSPDPGDGKSTLSGNLAVCMAQSGKRVLLVDADFRRPRVHKLFGCESTTGLSGVIKGTSDLPEAVIQTEIENLSLLPCGPRPANPSELLSSHRFSELIHVLREQYDIVLIDTPPVLAVTDPCVVAPRVDGVVLLIRITKHVRPHAKRALESLESLGANLLGIVVNGVGGMRPGTGYGFGSQYGHRYAYNSGYYDSYSYNYGAYHHYYDDEDEDSPTEEQVEARRAEAARNREE